VNARPVARPTTASRAREELAAWLNKRGFVAAEFDADHLIERTRQLLREAEEDDAEVRRVHVKLARAVSEAHELASNGKGGTRGAVLRSLLADLPPAQLQELLRVARDLDVKPPSNRTAVVRYWRAMGLFNDVHDVEVSRRALALLLLAAGQAQPRGDFEDALEREIDAVKHAGG